MPRREEDSGATLEGAHWVVKLTGVTVVANGVAAALQLKAMAEELKEMASLPLEAVLVMEV